MLIKVLKTTLASANSFGNQLKLYQQDEICDIYDELANTFLKEGWGEKAKTQELEIQTQEIQIETQEESVNLETQELKIKKKKK